MDSIVYITQVFEIIGLARENQGAVLNELVSETWKDKKKKGHQHSWWPFNFL